MASVNYASACNGLEDGICSISGQECPPMASDEGMAYIVRERMDRIAAAFGSKVVMR